jgi:phage shock protein PspC (stress-responsive transcriptional regulator)
MDISETLERLRALHQAGALSDSEYTSAKARVLGDASAAAPQPQAAQAPREASFLHRLHRSRKDRWFGGVCGGLGEQMDIPGWVLRLGFVLAACFAGTGALLYILLWIFVPQEPVAAPVVSGAAHA